VIRETVTQALATSRRLRSAGVIFADLSCPLLRTHVH
jgi:hypothetical protein